MRVLVCGGRAYPNADAVWAALKRLKAKTVITGDAKGADEHARNWARENANLEAYAANWKRYGNRAGPIRNQQMLTDGMPDIVLAFPGGRGTADMIRRAKSAGLPVLYPAESW